MCMQDQYCAFAVELRHDVNLLYERADTFVMDDEDDRRLLDIIGDVQALNDYLHGSSNKSINEDDVTNAAFGSASSFYTSSTGDPNSTVKDGTNHMAGIGGAGLPLHGSLQFIETELGGASPSGAELGEEQPFDILQKSLQEANITEQTLAQEALLESPPTSGPFPQQLVSGGFGGVSVLQPQVGGPFSGVPPHGFIQQAPPLQNGSAGHIQILGSFNGPPSMMTINSLEPPQILLRPGDSASPGLGGGVLVQRQGGHPGATQGAVFNAPAGGQMSVPFKGCGTPVPLQNIIIQRGSSPQMLVKSIQPKPIQLGGQTVYSISGAPSNSPSPAPQQMTVDLVNQHALQKPAPVPQVVNHSGSIMIHSPLGQQQQQQQQQGSLPQGQYLLPSSMALTPGTTTQTLAALNGQVLHTQLQGTADPASANAAYSGAFLTNQSAAVQLVAGQNFASSGQLIVNQALVSGQMGQASPALVQVSQAVGARPKSQAGYTANTPVQGGYTLINSSDAGQVEGYTPQGLGVQNRGLQGLQTQQQVSVSLGPHVLVPLTQDGTQSGTQGTSESQFETQSYQQTQVSHSLSPAPKQLQPQPQLVNLLGAKGGKPVMGLETVVCLPNQAGTPHVPNAQISKLKRPAPQQLSKGGLVLQLLRQDQGGALSGSRSPFTSPDDAVRRLLPYHVFQGALPSAGDFHRVDEEFEAVATQVLKRTEAMLNKYRRLLLVDAERTSPSSEMVMIDRTFNQEERSNLTQDKRMVLVDPDGFLEDFCCRPKPVDTVHPCGVQGGQDAPIHTPHLPSPCRRDPHTEGRGWEGRERGGADPSLRTELQPGAKDPGGEEPEVSLNEHLETAIKSILQLKRTQGRPLNSNPASKPALLPPVVGSAPRSPPAKPLPPDYGQPQLADTDSVLEAAVNSILEC
ncbi:hypothetical protein GJAV_G00240890 [Gymnothorax javanicus]|nr:hypothetical protein GJAV_G00240890 [Gymnothorax javanicus]